jgi:FkbM family methyltransferase
LNLFDYSIKRRSKLKEYYANSFHKDEWKRDIQFTLEFGQKVGPTFIELMELSKSQFRQDIFALTELGFKKNGFFVEFGATNGVTLSNTYLLEKRFGYNGILSEPNPKQLGDIRKQRTSFVDNSCVWRETGQTLKFIERGDLSTLENFSELDMHGEKRKGRPKFDVETISLSDLCRKYHAPAQIDYLSIDTEGSELEILSHHKFDEYTFKVITVEHNYTKNRDKIFSLLTSNGYERKFEHLSHTDDWYSLKNS